LAAAFRRVALSGAEFVPLRCWSLLIKLLKTQWRQGLKSAVQGAIDALWGMPLAYRCSNLGRTLKFACPDPEIVIDNNDLFHYFQVNLLQWRRMGWFFSKPTAVPGWMTISIDPDVTKLAHVSFNSEGRPVVGTWSVIRQPSGQTLQQLSRNLNLANYHCSTLLRPGDYQLLLVEAPNVTPDELKGAIRWKIKDLIEYHVDDATIDVLDIPAPAGKAHSMYAVSARNDLLQRQIKDFEGAQIPLEVIDIPETAQRNMAQLFGDVERAVAMVSFDLAGGLLTISYAGELYLARRIEVAWDHLAVEIDAERQRYLERVTTELQRSLDHFERQFTHLSVTQLLLAPLPTELGIAAYLSANIAVPVRAVDIAEVMDLPQTPEMGPEAQWRLFHVLGAGLRRESKAL